MQLQEREDLLVQILAELSHYRKILIDAVEQEAVDSPRWTFLRKRLLSYLGKSGLEGRIESLFRE